jgi:hypothetical protein
VQAAPELRPLGVGDIVDRVFSIYRARFGPLLAVAALPYLVFAIAAAAIGFAAASSLVPFLGLATRLQGRAASPADAQELLSSLADLIPIALAILFVAVAFTVVQSAAIVRFVAGVYMGRPATIAEALRTGLVAFPRLLLMGLVAVVAFLVLWAGVITLVVLASIAVARSSPGLVIVLLVIVVPALLVATLYLQASWMVSPAVAILERAGPLQALGRSWHLSGGSRWRIIGLQLLLGILQIVLSTVLSVVLIAGQGSDQTVRLVLQQGVNLIANIMWAPIYWGTFAVLYYDLRVRKEALDLEVAVEALPRDT